MTHSNGRRSQVAIATVTIETVTIETVAIATVTIETIAIANVTTTFGKREGGPARAGGRSSSSIFNKSTYFGNFAESPSSSILSTG